MSQAPLIEHIGGENAVRALVETFYDLMESLPEGAHLRLLHERGQGMNNARSEQFAFMCGFLGGRRYYAERHGHMNLREIHAHVPVRHEDAENWLICMDRALSDCGHSGPEVDRLRGALRRAALRLVNDLGEWGVRPESAPV
ncbi:group II truncated hemoglobin [Roseinatronobacter bogoriensis]|uniref:Cyanoglobin n=1 Tax=Roseinatronobacter bogoriensis subsp. barguzinensis TaxID=441209 RepID=A0A2K8KE03_9RHOB|nr:MULTISPECIES: group II truncated hemoglobin [Rhodobaca]ATX64998.1 cyanoglobin [Rhodobaca barguzinensis]MBB4208820.1 hemoglobin [Rhodobaca bogoriensis DSM 18756]TDW37912.1 hemoglobin [Rhodobaca barguzinensis]TDY69918.1 hemoglobin [Rhodobaca bogoriensis DSM 18756]